MSERSVASKFRIHSTAIAVSALGTAAAMVVPVLADAERQGIALGVVTITNATIVGLGVAYLMWSSAWVLPVVMNAATAWLERIHIPMPLTRAVVLTVSPLLLVACVAYGAIGGGVAQYRRVRRAAIP